MRLVDFLNRYWNKIITVFLLLWLLWYNIAMRYNENYCANKYKDCLELCYGVVDTPTLYYTNITQIIYENKSHFP